MVCETAQDPAGQYIPALQQIVSGVRAISLATVGTPVGANEDTLLHIERCFEALHRLERLAICVLEQPEQMVVVEVGIPRRPEA